MTTPTNKTIENSTHTCIRTSFNKDNYNNNNNKPHRPTFRLTIIIAVVIEVVMVSIYAVTNL